MQPRALRSYALAVPTGDYSRKRLVPLYMDIHTVHGGAPVDGVAQDHAADLKAQGVHDVRYLRYWVSEAEGKIFCLVDAPSAEAAPRRAGGLARSRQRDRERGTDRTAAVRNTGPARPDRGIPDRRPS